MIYLISEFGLEETHPILQIQLFGQFQILIPTLDPQIRAMELEAFPEFLGHLDPEPRVTLHKLPHGEDKEHHGVQGEPV